MKTSKKLYVVFNTRAHDVAFITDCKEYIEAFFKRDKREGNYFYRTIKDPDKIELFERDFGDKYPEVIGSTVLTDFEYYEMSDSIPNLVSDLTSILDGLIDNIKYLKLTDAELYDMTCMCKVLRDKLNQYFEDDVDDSEIFDEELICIKYLDCIGE